ncbi:VCBS repeat-containing protein [Candidatus Merdisoma sp. JLR.KK006]|uniref:FG-GAP repeat domain-containing protein n=1 Tax=Candidatus Merdisoma sp. JLR.KK006 TaxID=3112626 RepID=UPI002FEE9BCB
MKKWMKKISRSILVLMCVGTASLCTSGKNVQASQEEAGAVQSLFQKAGNETAPDAEEEKNYLKKQMEENRERFFEEAQRQGIGSEQAEKLFGRLLEDKIFQNGALALTGLRLDDIDGNGQMDMLLMVQDAEQIVFYGSGGLWFYMNEDTPYCFDEEECSYYGIFDVFWADVDNDENVEIVFSAEGFGCGAVGDSYKAVFKYKNHTMERMELPSDLEIDHDCGLVVDVIQEPEADSYSAYCPYLDELIPFGRENECPPPEMAEAVGGNARGFYDLSMVEYEGKNVLQASEYLYGEGGVADCAAIAQFLITWEEDGTPVVLKWWIEEAF